jgi:hypothetical protein
MSIEKPVIVKDPQGRQKGEIQLSDPEEARNLKRNSQGQIGSVTDLQGNKLAEEEVPPQEDTKQADAVNIAKELGKVLANALREHGDEMQGVFIKDMNTRGVTIKVTYKPDEQGEQTEDEFVFRWDNGVIRLDNVGEPVDLGQIQNKSGRSTIQKDVLKDRLLQFLSSHDSDPAPSDPAEIPDGQPVQEEWPDDHIGQQDSADGDGNYQEYDAQSLHEDVWESEDCQNAFCAAVDAYRQAKDKDSIKSLFRACRPFKKGNTIQEKLKGAVEWYNSYKQPGQEWSKWGNPPKNTRVQVFLEDDYDGHNLLALKEVSDSLSEAANKLQQLEGDYKRDRFDEMSYTLSDMVREIDEYVDYMMDGNETKEEAFYRDDDDDRAVLGEEDEFGPEIGDEVDYNEGRYKLYGYCGYEVVLQNVDDERDFKVVKPVDIGMGSKQEMKETEYIDPEQLPDM